MELVKAVEYLHSRGIVHGYAAVAAVAYDGGSVVVVALVVGGGGGERRCRNICPT